MSNVADQELASIWTLCLAAGMTEPSTPRDYLKGVFYALKQARVQRDAMKAVLVDLREALRSRHIDGVNVWEYWVDDDGALHRRVDVLLDGENSVPLITYVTADDRAGRSAAFLRTYATRVRDGTAATWEIPNTIASTLEDIATWLEQHCDRG